MSEEQFKENLKRMQLLEAAAPDLFDACFKVLEAMYRGVGVDEEVQSVLISALKKAKGIN